MIRKEEIQQAADANFSSIYKEAFIMGAEWADSTMIDKACNYFRNQEYSDVFIEDFRKAMKE